jgi:sugar lactone lactonase YvrE
MNTAESSLKNILHARARLGEGLCWNSEEQLLYWVDIYNHRVHQFNPATGTDNGCIWSAMWDGWCVIRFDPSGKEMMRVKMPVVCPTACTFGGEDLTTLYITTASVGLSQEEIQKSFYSGDLFSLQTSTSDLPTYHFRG